MCGDVRRRTSTRVDVRRRTLTDVDVRPSADVNVRWRAQCEWALWLLLWKCLMTVARSVNFCIYVRNDNKTMRNYLCISVYSFTYNLAILTQPYDSRMRIHALIKRSLTTHWLHFVASRTAKIGSRWIPVLIPVYRYWFFPIPKYRYWEIGPVLQALDAMYCQCGVKIGSV